jgi:hypothetical protein
LTSGRRTTAATSIAADSTAKGNVFVDASRRFLQRQRHVAANVGTATRPPSPPSPTPTAEQIAKHSTAKEVSKGFKDVLDIIELVNPFNTRVAVPVIAFSLLSIAENLVRLGRLFELSNGRFVIAIAVGMVFDCQFAISAIDFCFRSGPLNLEHLVVAGFCGHVRCLLPDAANSIRQRPAISKLNGSHAQTSSACDPLS